jgi:hypothetical protein
MKGFLITLPLIMLVGCGDITYRYECQNPDNQGLPQCQPEVCGPTKTCFNDLAGFSQPTNSYQSDNSVDPCAASGSGSEDNFE